MTRICIYLMISLVKLCFPKYWFVNTAVIYAQAVHETSLNGKPFSSNVYKQNNNLFGMRHPTSSRKDQTTSIGVGIGEDSMGQAKYKSKISSIWDYFLWLKHMNISPKNFMANVVSKWKAQDKDYLKKWSSHVKKQWKFSKFLYAIIAVVILIVIYVFKKKRPFKKGQKFSW